ncbi:hypothetical protein COLO4_04034 [Corchorus olitorius]|uniref:RING-type domain-containing protein n=1 Tax=Corchorus olitorius TaxID=93759 RepID=A0A1R3KVP1_9ROSI|nr:hypothetical protein COLO4_04034 [Corchorus olitorius]
MGQTVNTLSLGQRQSKDELLYQAANSGNVDAVKALCREGAGLEWIDADGKTPLIAACMNPELVDVAKTLIEMGANVNAYRPGLNAGTPLHHAAKRGLEWTVIHLLAHGANALLRNDDCHTPLEVARIKGYTNIVRAIGGFLCGFSPQLSRKIWVVILPCSSENRMEPPRFELSIYSTLQDAQPQTVIALWKAKIEEPRFHQSNPSLAIFDQSTKTRYKLASGNEGDKDQIQWLYNACKGIPQVIPSPSVLGTQTSSATNASQTHSVAVELDINQSSGVIHANGWEDSVAVESYNGWGPAVRQAHSESSDTGRRDQPTRNDYNGWYVPGFRPTGKESHPVQNLTDPPPIVQTSGTNASISTAPSAPPAPDDILGEGPIHYPSIDLNPVDLPVPLTTGNGASASQKNDAKEKASSSKCIICWEAPVEGACIPCGHMAGCMSCLNEIKTKKGRCPVCRAKITKVLKLYAV